MNENIIFNVIRQLNEVLLTQNILLQSQQRQLERTNELLEHILSVLYNIENNTKPETF